MLQLTKHYYKPHIEEIKHRLKAAKDLGNASADEWIKGLEAEGKDRLSEVIRWEQWEAKGGLRKVNPRPHQRAAMTQGQTNLSFKTLDTKGGPNSERSTPLGMRIPSRLSGDSGSPASASPIHYPYFHQPPSSKLYLSLRQHYFANFFEASVSTPWTTAVPHAENSLPRNPMSISQLRPERNLRDVNEAKAARRAEIERRCAALDPPLLPSVLAHMETFQAAMQISQPLSDHAWQVLKPRLLTQRAYAERKEKDRLEQSQILQAEYKQRRQQEAQLKETKESLDREWASIQTPIRSRIGELADEIINNTWAYGKSVTKDNCAKFAADVLLYVHQRFYDEVAQENKDSILNGEEYKDANPNLPTSRILILENMKWLFDTKIKPLTEHFQKELFLCNGCDNFKFYGLDSVVQHYAAKHTHDLSLGNQVVHWRAEWPKHPPFHPEPSVAKAAYYKIPTPLGTSLQPVKQEGYAPVSYPVSQSAYNGSQYSPRSYQESYGQDHQQEKHPSLSFTQTFPHAIPGVPGQVQEFQQNPNFGGAYNALQTTYANAVSASNGPQPTRFGQLLPTDNQVISRYAKTNSCLQDQRSTGLPGYDYFSRNHGGASIPQHQSNSQPKTLSFQRSYPEHNRDLIGQALELYQPQIEEIAKYAREVWFATSGIKDIPQSVRIFVVIQHMVARFKAVFPNEPSLAMFIDGLDHSQLMRPIRSLNGLACKVCVTGGSSTSGEPLPIGDRRLYTLPHLLNHFRTAHMETTPTFNGSIGVIESSRLDWKLDMIELPEEPLIADLINAPGLDDTKLDLIARVFPGVFPSPLPRMGIASNIGPVPVYSESFDRGTRSLSKVGPEAFRVSPSRHEGRLEDQQFNRSYSSYREISQPARSSEPPGEDEYDPHRPALPSVVSSIHTRKPAMAPSTDNTTPSTLKSRQDTYSMVSEAIERPEPVYNIPPSRRVIGIHDASPYYEQSNRTRSRASYQDVVRPLAEDRFGDEHAAHREQPLDENPNRNNTAVDASTKHKDISEDGEVVDRSTSFKPMQRSLSSNEEANAADQFLDNLVSSPDLNSGHRIIPFDREGSRSIARREEMPQDRNRMKHVDANEESQGWRAELAVGQKQELDPAGSMRDNPSIQRVYEENCPPRRCYDQHHRSPSQLQHTPNVSRIGRRSTETFAAYEAPQHTVGDNRYEMRGRVEVPRISDGPFHVATHPRYRSRSMSPRPLPLSTTYYRTRSPGEDYRHEPIYHIRSPTLRKDAQRIISYDYPVQDRYEYYDERNMPHNQLRPRVEYVPVRFRESAPIEPSRFVLTQPTEMRPQSDYVRLDRGHPGEPVYERHGQLYHADPSPVFSQQGYGAPTFSPGYRY